MCELQPWELSKENKIKKKQQNKTTMTPFLLERSGFPIIELDIRAVKLHIHMTSALTPMSHVYLIKHFLDTLTHFIHIILDW